MTRNRALDTANDIFPDTRVSVYDPRIDAFAQATVLCRYGRKQIWWGDVCYDEYGRQYGEPAVWIYPDLVDVRFDHDGRESRGHFTDGVTLL